MSRRDFWMIALISSVFSSGLTLFILYWSAPPPASAVELTAPLPPPPDLTQEEQTNVEIYERVSPAVVNITSISMEYNWFYEIIPRRGIGSGILIDKQGHVVTNYHVIEGARHLEVTLHDKTVVEAEVVGTDPPNDLAVLLIECPQKICRPAVLGKSDVLRVGQSVLAIGNPFGLQHTLTTGIISSTGRSLRTEKGYVENVIQTDAAINPGNSGGPLLNTQGEIIGINTAIFSRTGESAGIGFAIPVDTLSSVLPDLIEHGRVVRPWMGVSGRSLTSRLARALDAPVAEGFLVERVEEGSTADLAGLRGGKRRGLYGNSIIRVGGDIVVEIDGQEVRNRWDILRALQDKRPGDKVGIVYYRRDRKREKTIELVGDDSGGRRIRF